MLDNLTFSIDTQNKKNIQRGLFFVLALLYIVIHIFDINTPYIFMIIDFVTLFSLVLFTRNTEVKQSFPAYILFILSLLLYLTNKRLNIYFFNFNNYATGTLLAYSALL